MTCMMIMMAITLIMTFMMRMNADYDVYDVHDAEYDDYDVHDVIHDDDYDVYDDYDEDEC